jgi:hypothetical protein
VLKSYQPLSSAVRLLTPAHTREHIDSMLDWGGWPGQQVINDKGIFLATYMEPLKRPERFLPSIQAVISRCVEGMARIGEARSDGMVEYGAQTAKGFSNRTVSLPGYHHVQINSGTLGRSGPGSALGKMLLSVSPR